MMNNKRRFLAFLLQWVFFLPIVVQSWHPLFHHHSCESHHEVTAAVEHEVIMTASGHSHDECLVCEYQFPVNDLPETIGLSSLFFVFEELSVSAYQKDIPGFHYLHLPSRAPPAIC